MSAPKVDVLSECAEFTSRQIKGFRACKPMARKSFGSYKPLIRYSNGMTEVCGQRRELRHKVWIDGKPDHKSAYVKNYRGLTFATQQAAVEYAAGCIAAMIEKAERRLAGFQDRAERRAALAHLGAAQ